MTTDKPNIVVFSWDNFGWGELGCYGGGILREAPTPRIDALAGEGKRLLNFNVEAQWAAMTRTPRRHDNRSSRRQHPAVLVLLALLIGGGLLVGCGSSSKPAYCSPVSKVENAVKSLPTVDDVKKNGVGTLKSALVQLQQNATAAIDQAKSDFSGQTTALKTSVDGLSSTVKQVVGTPSLQTLAQLAAELSAVRAAAKNLQTAVSSKCG